MRRYIVVIDKTETGYGAWVPDLPGCVASGGDLVETQRLIREAIQLHIESLQKHGELVPEPTTHADYVEVAVPSGA